MTIKNTYTLLSLFIILFSCRQAQKHNATQSTIVESPAINDVLREYELHNSNLDTLNVETATIAAEKYLELFAKQNVNIRDKGFIIFNHYYEKLDRNINVLHEKDTTDFSPLIMLDTSGRSLAVSQKLKDYSQGLKRNGFQVSSTEGESYIQQDRDFIEKWFYSHVSPVMKAYLKQLNKENKEGFQEDAGLTIEPKQYVNRLVWWENFVLKNNNFYFVTEAKENRKFLLTFFLIGMENSPVLSFETNELDDYYKTAYSYLQNTFSNSQTNRIVNPYFKALSQKDTIKAASLIEEYKRKDVIKDF